MNKYMVFTAVVICLALAAGDSITGLLIGETKAITLNDRAAEFFDVDTIVFPNGQCMQSITGLYNDIANTPVDASSGYSSHGADRFATTSFVVERHEIYGTMDFVKSPTFLGKRDADSYISFSSEAIIRVPKATKRTYLVMDLLGVTEGRSLFLTKGRMSTPTADCIFWVQPDGTQCRCNVHTTLGIALGGVTASPKVEDRMAPLLEGFDRESLYDEIW